MSARPTSAGHAALRREAEFLTAARQLPPSLMKAVLAAMLRRGEGEPWQTAVPAGFRDAGWSDDDAAPEVALMLDFVEGRRGKSRPTAS